MDDFLRRNAGAMTSDEFAKYAWLFESDPFITLQLSLFARRWEDEFDDAVHAKTEEILPESVKEEIAEKLQDLADEIDKVEENILEVVKYASYGDLSKLIEGFFEKFNEREKLRGE
jgi:hypothetical protein